MIAAATIDWLDVPRMRRTALIVAATGAVVAALMAFLNPVQFCRAYVVAVVFILGLPLGSMALQMIHSLTGGDWGEQLQPGLGAATRTLPAAVLLSAPLLFMAPSLYPWANEEHTHVLFQRAYLNVPFFVSRALGCYAIWLVLYLLTQKTSPATRAKWSGIGLILYGLTVTIASIDWVMSMEPPWASTIFPVLFAAGQGLQASALAIAVSMFLTPNRRSLAASSQRDLGNLLLMFVMLWAYLSLSQYLLIWSANLPEEIPWYLRRLRGDWEWIAILLIAFQFALPFALLLSRAVKQRPAALGAVAVLVLAMRYLDVFWWIEAAPVHDIGSYWIADIAALAAIGGAWAWEFGRQFQPDAERGVV